MYLQLLSTMDNQLFTFTTADTPHTPYTPRYFNTLHWRTITISFELLSSQRQHRLTTIIVLAFDKSIIQIFIVTLPIYRHFVGQIRMDAIYNSWFDTVSGDLCQWSWYCSNNKVICLSLNWAGQGLPFNLMGRSDIIWTIQSEPIDKMPASKKYCWAGDNKSKRIKLWLIRVPNLFSRWLHVHRTVLLTELCLL